MSLEGLRKMGLLRAEHHWNGDHQPSRVATKTVLIAAGLALAACAAMVLGNGGWLTWLGIVGFLVALFLFIAVNLRGITGEEQPGESDS